MTDEERDEIIIDSRPLTQREKELEATVKFTPVSPTVKVKEMKPAENGGFKEETVVVGREFPDLKEIAENAGRYGFAHHVVRCIGDKGEVEIYELLDYWYGLDKRKTRQSFVDCVLECIDKERRAGYTLPCITPVKIKWINSWVNADSPIVRKAFKHPKLRKWFYERVEQRTGEASPEFLLRVFIKYCETVSPPNISRAASEHLPNHCGKECYDVLKEIGLNVGSYEVWRKSKSR